MLRYIINFFSKLGVDVVSRLLSLVTLPLIARTLGVDGYGLYSYLSVLLGYYGFFIDLGYYVYGTSEICRSGDAEAVVNEILSVQTVVVLLSLAVLTISGFLFFDSKFLLLMLISSTTLLFQPFLINYYYIANRQLYYISFAQLASQLLFVALVWLGYARAPSLLLLVIITQTSSLVSAAIMFVPYARKTRIHLRIHPSALLATLKKVYRIGIASKLEGITTTITPLIIGASLSTQDLGIYSAAFKVFILLFASVQSLQQTIMPLIFKADINAEFSPEKMSTVFYINVAFGLIFGAGVFVFAAIIITLLYGKGFLEAIYILRYFAFAIMLWPTHSFVATMLIAMKKQSAYLITTVVSSTFAVLFSLICIPLFGLHAAVLVLPFTAAIGLCTSLYLVRRSLHGMNIDMHRLFDWRPSLQIARQLVAHSG